MNREIKFRAWDRGKMYRDLAYITMSGSGMSRIPDRPLIKPILMQYTGLKDKNGVEIYEGDIVTDGSLVDDAGISFAAEIGLKDGSFRYLTTNCGCGECVGAMLFDELDVVKVIGNIYENPHLLNK